MVHRGTPPAPGSVTTLRYNPVVSTSEQPAAFRTLGRTGAQVLPVSLGGEGVLRTTGRAREAVPVILEALRLGVRYCDTAPAYQQSQEYYGEAFRAAGPGARDGGFLASKTHERTRSRALRLLDDSLRRLGTDHLDLWQMHDLREHEEINQLFAKDGAMAAALEAQADGRIRFIGLTGHHDPAVLQEAMRRHRFDSVLLALNPADPQRLPFAPVVAEARRQGMGVVAMKVLAAGRLVEEFPAPSLIRYAASLADTAIIGCSSVDEVRENLAAACALEPMPAEEMRALERQVARRRGWYDYFKMEP
jgi:aryl-alcohol dehydrogenase-like predicted oxidoreductase